jgi:chromosome segregation ATPase
VYARLMPDKLLGETMPQFVMNYCKNLFDKALNSKNEQVSELQSKSANFEMQVNFLREKLEEEQTAMIEQRRRQSEMDSELKIKDIQIERLQRKTVQDLEILEENCKSLEDRLKEKNEDVKTLKEVANIYKPGKE